MAMAHGKRRTLAAMLLVLATLLFASVVVPYVPALAENVPAQSGGPCSHVLRAAVNRSGPTVECFLNATGSLTFTPNKLFVPANSTIVFTVGNIGGLPHTFTLDNLTNDSQLATWTANPAGVSTDALKAHLANYTALNLYVNGSGPYTSNPVSLPDSHGIFYFVCLFPGHFSQGMFGRLFMGIAPPPPTVVPTLNSPVQVDLLLAALALIVATVVLMLNVWPVHFPRWMRSIFHSDDGHGVVDPNALRSWVYTTDHKRIGILYLITALFFFFMAGSFAELMRTQLMVPSNTVASAAVYDQLVTMHGLIMALFFMSPFAFAFANYIIPLQIGAKDMAFPRLNALSYWLYLFGGVLLLSGIFLPGGAISSGWTLYAPLNETPYLPQPGMDAALAGILLLAISVILSTFNIATTVARHRAKGYHLMDMPMFVWGVLFTLAMMWMAFPDVTGAVALLTLDRTLGSEIFLSPAGGALLWQQLFWFFGHPEVYILIFPAFGAMYDMASVFSGKPIFGKRYVIYSMAAITVLSMGVWLHHMFMTGTNIGWLDLQSFTTGAISIPSDTMVLGILFTIVGGRIRYKAPMLFTLGAIPLFIIGGITGVLTSVPALDVEFHGTYWVVGHFHYMLAGTSLWGLTAATYYWYPKMAGKMYSEKIARVHFVLAAVGINLLYMPFLDLYDMPRRVYTYLAVFGFGDANFFATLGGYVYGLAQIVFVINLVYSLRKGETATDNPWGAPGFEWQTTSPPPPHNFDGDPRVEGDRMIIVPSPGPHHAPRLSPWPFMVALGAMIPLAGVVAWEAWQVPYLLGFGMLVLVFAVVGWALEDYRDKVPLADQGERETWPFTGIRNVQFATLVFISGDLAFVGALVGSYYFVGWQSTYFSDPVVPLGGGQSVMLTVTAILVLLASVGSILFALHAARAGKWIQSEMGLVLTFFLGGAFIALNLINWQVLAAAGMGISTISNNMTASMFYDFSIIHIVHVVAMLTVVGYFAIRIPTLIPDGGGPLPGPASKDEGDRLDGLAAATYLWTFIAAFGVVLLLVFMVG